MVVERLGISVISTYYGLFSISLQLVNSLRFIMKLSPLSVGFSVRVSM